VARIELLDALQVHAINLASNLGLPETTLLLMEFHGSAASVAEQSERFGEIAEEFDGGPFVWTTKPEDRTKLWEARHNAAMSNFALRPGAAMIATDVCVPISRLAECVTATQADIAETGIVAPIVGHVGDGNFHLTLLIDMDDEGEVARAKGLSRRLVERALAMDGTSTGEHGVGQGKMEYMLAEHGPAAVAVMASIKRAFDPQNILNPGKIVALN
jgi:D-lactate dehydrogenase (cytochrome)